MSFAVADLIQGAVIASHLFLQENLPGCFLKMQGELVDISKHGHACIGQASPARHLDHKAASGVLHYVARVDGQRGEAEDRVAGFVHSKVNQRAEGVPGSAMVHVRHDGAQVRKLCLLHLQTADRFLRRCVAACVTSSCTADGCTQLIVYMSSAIFCEHTRFRTARGGGGRSYRSVAFFTPPAPPCSGQGPPWVLDLTSPVAVLQ